MEKFFSRAFNHVYAGQASPEVDSEEKCLHREKTASPVSSPEGVANVDLSTADPKVAEFFKNFPEPLKQKLIKQYSTRDGLYRWDIFRNRAMEREKSNALQGIFSEAVRETEDLKKELEELEREKDYEETKKKFYSREIPEWEQQVLKVVPLQPGDSMVSKLLQTVNLSVLGLLFLSLGMVQKPQRTSKVLRGQTVFGCFGLFVWFQVAAVTRLMDLGPFDRSVDERDWDVKVVDDLKEPFRIIGEFLSGQSSRP